jgi:hypothetical protein
VREISKGVAEATPTVDLSPLQRFVHQTGHR